MKKRLALLLIVAMFATLEELRDKVQATLDEMGTDGTVAEIAEKYAVFGVLGSLCIGK